MHFARRLTVFIIGVCFSFVLIEAGLRVFGFFYKDIQQEQSPDNNNAKADFVILCLGDSRAFGLGAQKGKSFPAQLEIKLNSIFAPKKISVINKGFPGDNTWQVKKKLKQQLLSNRKINLVVLIAGQNNFWNFTGLEQSTGKTGLYYWLQTNIHIIQLVALLKKNISQKEFSISDNLKNRLARSDLFTVQLTEDIEKIKRSLPENTQMDVLDDISQISPQNIDYWKEQGAKQQQQRNDTEFVHCTNNVISLLNKEPDSEQKKQDLIFLLSEAACAYKCLGQYEKACLYFISALNLDPLADCHQDLCMTLLSREKMWPQARRASIRHLCLHPKETFPFISMALWTQHDKREQIQTAINDFSLPVSPGLKTILNNNYKSTDITKWIEADLKEMITLCNSNNIPIFLLGDIKQQIVEPVIYQKLANNYDVTYIKSQMHLLKKLEQKCIVTIDIFNSYLAGDLNHPNEKGYAFMAKCIIDQIQNKNLL